MDESPCMINARRVLKVKEVPGGTKIWYADGRQFVVRETYVEVQKALMESKKR